MKRYFTGVLIFILLVGITNMTVFAYTEVTMESYQECAEHHDTCESTDVVRDDFNSDFAEMDWATMSLNARLSKEDMVRLAAGESIITSDGLFCAFPVVLYQTMNRIEEEFIDFIDFENSVTSSSFIIVNVHIPADQHYRTTYGSNWQNVARNDVSNASSFYYSEFQVALIVGRLSNWSSPTGTTTVQQMFASAVNNHGLAGQDIMIAMTGRPPSDVGDIAGWGTVGGPHSLLMDQGSTANRVIIRHEVGHNYGMVHCSASCFMHFDATMYSNYSSMCSGHRITMGYNRALYGR